MNTAAIECFVPDCRNKNTSNDKAQPLHFFKVPSNIANLLWEKAVSIRTYDKIINLLNESENVNQDQAVATEYKFFCDVHSDITADIERIASRNGIAVNNKLWTSFVPQINSKQTINHNECDEFTTVTVKEEPIDFHSPNTTVNYDGCQHDATSKNHFVSVVDISKLIKVPVICEPTMPMLQQTIAMIKRKSTYYTGLQKRHFLDLLKQADRKHISEVKVMLTLRKLRLNEEFEALGDLFDLDKITTEKYFNESMLEVRNLIDVITSNQSLNHLDQKPNGDCSVAKTTEENRNFVDFSKTRNVITKDELYQFYTSSSAESKASESSGDSYTPSEHDTDVNTDDFTSTSDDDSDFSSGSDQPLKGQSDQYCHLCNEYFTARGIYYHIRKAHSLGLDLNKRTCGLCLQKFPTKDLLRSHQDSAHNGNAFGCDCGKQFQRKNGIVRHVLIDHAKLQSHLCDECGTGFAFEYDLTKHVRRCHRYKIYECHLCTSKYRTSYSRQAHIVAAHTNERPFKCDFTGCNKAFNRKSSRDTHRRVHRKDKFECQICSKQFSFKCNLTAHKRNIHGMMQ